MPSVDAYAPDTMPDPTAARRILGEHQIDFATIDPHRKPWNPFADRVSLFGSLDPLRAFKILFGRRDVDVLISVGEASALLIMLLRKLFSFNPAITLWDAALGEEWKLRDRILDFIIPRVSAMFVLCHEHKRYIEARWRPPGQIIVVGHLVDTEFFRPRPSHRGDYILAVGDDFGRDYATLVEAWEGLDVDLVIRTSADLDLAPRPRLKIVRERLSFVELRDLYANCRFVAVPLRPVRNASGVTCVLETASMGKAAVVSGIPSIQDFIIGGQTCLEVPAGDPQQLRKAMARLLDDSALCEHLGANARVFVERTAALEVFYARLAQNIRRVLMSDVPSAYRRLELESVGLGDQRKPVEVADGES